MAVTCPLTGRLLAAVHRATGPPPDAAALTADECAGALPGPVVEAAGAPGRALAGENVLAYAKRLAARNIFRYCRRPCESVDEMGLHAAPPVGDDHRSSRHDSSAGRRRLGASPRPGAARTARRPARPEGARPRQPRLRPNRDADGNRERRDLDDAGDPRERTLLVTHIPLWRVPAGRVNGHVHNRERLRPETSINICVEQTGYRPLPLEAVRELAARGLEESRRRPSSGCLPRRRLPTQSSPAVPGGSAWRSDCAGRRPASTCSSSRPAGCPARLGWS